MNQIYTYIKKIIFILTFIFVSIQVMSQGSYPITITLQIKPPYPLKITDYSEDPTKIIAIINNVSASPVYMWITGSIIGDNGVSLATSMTQKPKISTTILPGEVKTVFLNELKTILNFDQIIYSGITKDDVIKYGLPEASYFICLQALDYNTGLPLSEGEPRGCVQTTISSIEPSIIIKPICDEKIQATSLQNIIFLWSIPIGAPPHTQYTLKITEVIPLDRNVDDAMKSSTTPIFFEQSGITGNVFVYGPAQPKLIQDRKYAFVVIAKDPFGKISFKNDGASEICSFIYENTFIYRDSLTSRTAFNDSLMFKDTLVYKKDTLKNTTLIQGMAVASLIIPPLPSVLPSYTRYIKNNFTYKDSSLAALLTAYLQAKVDDDKYLIAEISFYIGRKFLLNYKFDEARQYFIESIDTLKSIHSTRNLWIPMCNLAFCLKETSNLKSCQKILSEAIKIVETNPLQSNEKENSPYYSEMINGQKLLYELMIEQMMRLEDTDSALFYTEKNNNYGKSRTRGVEPVYYQDNNSKNFLEQENKLYNQIDSLYALLIKESSVSSINQDKQKINSLSQIYTVTENNYLNFIDSIVVAKPELSVNFSSNINPKDFFRDKQLIPENTVVVEYLISDSAIYIFLVRRDTIIAKTIPANKTTIETSIDKYVQLLSKNTKIEFVMKISSELYNYLILPIENILRPNENIAIVPTGKLLKLPFQSLVKTGKDGNENLFLIEKNSIYYINSLRLFYISNTNVTNNYKVVAFGNPDNSLPFAEEEVNELKIINAASEIYVRDKATETKAKNIEREFDVIHFATHGILDFSKFQNSYILLASDKDKKEDGKLTLSEIVGITNLRNFNMVTLSACNTAVTDQKIKGWINNPAQAFIDIGVKSVIATLWSVDDKATSMIMKEFYTNLKTKNKVQSLHDAQIKLIKIKEFRHPYYWSPFVLIGDFK